MLEQGMAGSQGDSAVFFSTAQLSYSLHHRRRGERQPRDLRFAAESGRRAHPEGGEESCGKVGLPLRLLGLKDN
jgi:hypothetical protein